VGLPKTGSTTLQRRWYRNRHNLLQQGIWYPEPDAKAIVPKHQYLVGGLMRNNHDRLVEDLESAQGRNTVLTTEGLTNHLYDFSEDALAGFRSITAQHDVTCIVVLRRPEAWIKSYYKQSILNPRIALASADFYGSALMLVEFRDHPRVQALSQFDRLQQDIAQSYNARQIRTFYLEEDWESGIDQALGIDTDGWSAVADENVSPPDYAVEILRQVNAYALPEIERLKWRAGIQAFTGSNHTAMKAALSESDDHLSFGLAPEILAALSPELQPELFLSADVLVAFREFVGIA
jgi:hypothetical protein